MSTSRPLVLLVDDDLAVAKVMTGMLGQAEIDARHAASGAEALAVLADMPVDVVVTDLRMPGMDGMQLLGLVKRQWPELPVLMMTAHGAVPLAVEAMKRGAADFLQKPFDRDEFLFVVRKAIESGRGVSSDRGAPPSPILLGTSPPMVACLELIARAAPASASVLLRGESGTGKELAARSLHQQSRRSGGPFVAIHCGALPETLLESELFGYEKGAFTGAVQRKPGRVELAEGGTLFLDEIGDITPAVQVKLLRLLQEREIQRLGGTQPIKVDVRIVAATHRNLEAMFATGQFREDLFFRLNIVPIWLPPLRDRAADIGPLAQHFCSIHGPANHRPNTRIDEDALALLRAQAWPGNVRELQNFIERLVVMSDGPVIGAADIERELVRPSGGSIRSNPPPASASQPPRSAGPLLDDHVRAAERDALTGALQKSLNNRTVAARILGVSRRTLYNKLEEYGLL